MIIIALKRSFTPLLLALLIFSAVSPLHATSTSKGVFLHTTNQRISVWGTGIYTLVLDELNRIYSVPLEVETTIQIIRQTDTTIFGLFVIPAPLDVETGPIAHYFIANLRENPLRIAVEYTEPFFETLAIIDAPSSLKVNLLSAAQFSTLGDNSSQLSFPWVVNTNATLSYGPHPDGFQPNPSAFSALDLVPQNSRVVAAHDGFAQQVICAGRSASSWVIVTNGEWRTSYYHLKNIQVSTTGRQINRGEYLGDLATNSTDALLCGGSWFGSHVHFALLRNGSQVNISGIDMGGWTIGGREFSGTMTRLSTGEIRYVNSNFSNEGLIGSGSDSRTAWDFSSSLNNWIPANHLNFAGYTDSAAVFNITGNDPYIVSPLLTGVSAANYPYVQIHFATTSEACGSIYFQRSTDGFFAEERHVQIQLINDGQLHAYSFPMSSNSEWNGVITRLRFDPSCTRNPDPPMTQIKLYFLGFGSETQQRRWAIDVNGDKAADWVEITDGYVQLATYINNGAGQFYNPVFSPTPFIPSWGWLTPNLHATVFPTDSNGDGRTDLVGIGGGGAIYVALSDGLGHFTTSVVNSIAFPWSDWFTTSLQPRVFVMDIDADKDDDLVGIASNGSLQVAHAINGNYPALISGGNSAYIAAQGWLTTGVRQTVFAADVDGDGDEDFLGIAADGRFVITRSNGDGTFQSSYVNNTIGFPWGSNWFTPTIQPRVWVMDIDNDGDDDIVGNGDSGQIVVSLNIGNGIYQTGVDTGVVAFGPQWGWLNTTYRSTVFTGDIDSDRDNDLLGIGASGNIYVYRATGNGSFQVGYGNTNSAFPWAANWFNPNQQPHVFLANADMDNDADFIGRADNGQFCVAISRGDATFENVRCASSIPKPPNLIQNGDFATPGAGGNAPAPWIVFGQPNRPPWSLTNGVLNFYRMPSSSQGVIYQQTNAAVATNGVLEAQFDLGNTSSARKRVLVLIHDSDFSDSAACTFWLPAHTTLRTYRMKLHTTEAWTNTTVSFYASNPADGLAALQLDNVNMSIRTGQTFQGTLCTDPSVPNPPGGVDSPNLLDNGDFSQPLNPTSALNAWSYFNQINALIVGGTAQIYRVGTPRGNLFQEDLTVTNAGTPIEVTFQMGNSENRRMRVVVLIHKQNFGDLGVCTFWLAPNTPMGNYTVRTVATIDWSDGTGLSIYPDTLYTNPVPTGRVLVDNVTMRQRPSLEVAGTECYEPGQSVPAVLPSFEITPTDEPVLNVDELSIVLPSGELPILATPLPILSADNNTDGEGQFTEGSLGE
jgi:LasA protease